MQLSSAESPSFLIVSAIVQPHMHLIKKGHNYSLREICDERQFAVFDSVIAQGFDNAMGVKPIALLCAPVCVFPSYSRKRK